MPEMHGWAGLGRDVRATPATRAGAGFTYLPERGSTIAAYEGTCALCAGIGGDLIWEDTLCRVVLAGGPDGSVFPGYCRVVWNRHVSEMSDLPAPERRHLMSVVFAAEVAVRQVASPDKINLASLGNVVAHLHWHVIPRWRDDSHFPAPIWAAARRPVGQRRAIGSAELRLALIEALGEEQGGGTT
jgi:diadenosine tetraphosphate (Ap4A) HIT family hydrolase